MTGTALGNPKSIRVNHDGSAATFRTQKFPSASVYSMAVSSSASASNRLSREFSNSYSYFYSYSFREALRLEAFGHGSCHCSVLLVPAVGGGSRHLQGSTGISEALALDELLSSAQPADYLLVAAVFAFHGTSPPRQIRQSEKLSAFKWADSVLGVHVTRSQ